LRHGLADIQRADEIALVRARRVVHRRLHRGHGRQVHNRRAFLHGGQDLTEVGDVTDDQLQRRVRSRQVAPLAGGQIVQHSHLVARLQQAVDQMRTDKTGAARYKDTGSKRCVRSNQRHH
jgi:hypothetical protein